jgi:preprotein translocase subunit YajC
MGGHDLSSEFFLKALPLVLVWMAFYGMVIWPSQQERMAHRAMIKRLKVGDPVMTTLGMRGIVRDLDEARRFIEVEIADGVVCSLSAPSVQRILPPLREEADSEPGAARAA